MAANQTNRTDAPAALEHQRTQLVADLCAWMGEGIPAGPADERRFTSLALRVFSYQFAANPLYRRYCERRGVHPDGLTHWRDIPAVATDAFKEAPLACFPAEQAERVFITSGTTRQVQRGRHFLRTLGLYHASLLPNFAAHLLPDGARLPAVVLFFEPSTMPESSLAHMFATVEPLTAGTEYSISPAGVDLEGALARLTALSDAGQPVLLMGTAFAFVHLLDLMAARDLRLALPPASRIMDTGGYKGRSREVPKVDLYALYTERLGVPDSHIVNEYGMTEMGSQFYDTALRQAALIPPGPWPPLPTPSPTCPDAIGMLGEGEHEAAADRLPQPSPSIGGWRTADAEGSRTANPKAAADQTPRPSPRIGRGRAESLSRSSGGRVRATRAEGGVRATLARRKQPPPWVRTLVVDPETLTPLPAGQTGVLRHFDLANLDSVMALQTADLGVADELGFEILGRAAGAEARGCSLAVEELLQGLGDR